MSETGGKKDGKGENVLDDILRQDNEEFDYEHDDEESKDGGDDDEGSLSSEEDEPLPPGKKASAASSSKETAKPLKKRPLKDRIGSSEDEEDEELKRPKSPEKTNDSPEKKKSPSPMKKVVTESTKAFIPTQVKKARKRISPPRSDTPPPASSSSSTAKTKAAEKSDEEEEEEKGASTAAKKRKKYDYATKLNYLFRDARFFLVKSNNEDNVDIAKSKGVWSTPHANENRFNRAFEEARNVLLIFSVKESGRFAGLARLATKSTMDGPRVNWVLPRGLSASILGGVFKIDWICRHEVSFSKTLDLTNEWNFGKPVKIGRDGQEIEPRTAEELCRLFPEDRKIDMTPILRRSKEAARQQRAKPAEDKDKAEDESYDHYPQGSYRGGLTSGSRKRRMMEEDYRGPPPQTRYEDDYHYGRRPPPMKSPRYYDDRGYDNRGPPPSYHRPPRGARSYYQARGDYRGRGRGGRGGPPPHYRRDDRRSYSPRRSYEREDDYYYSKGRSQSPRDRSPRDDYREERKYSSRR